MKPILIVSGNPEITSSCEKILAANAYTDVRLVNCIGLSNDNLMNTIRKIWPDVIIARGYKKKSIERTFSHITCVPLSATLYDLLIALQSAKKYGSKILLIADRSEFDNIDFYERLLDVEIVFCDQHSTSGIHHNVQRCIDAGISVAVGGYSVLSSLDLPDTLGKVPFGVEAASIIKTIEDARRINTAIAQIHSAHTHISQILAHTTNGMITVSTDSLVKSINPIAERILDVSENEVLGKPLDKICEPLSMGRVLSSGENDLDVLITYRGQRILCDKIAVEVDNVTYGGLVILQDVNKLHKSEASVRRKLAMSGMVADKTFADIVGDAQPLRKAVANAQSYAKTDYTILIYGESGTGKELFAQSIHKHSNRKNGPFVAINCAAMPPNLLESELFGYEPGAFTGASSKGKAGMLELSHDGTLFLDEIGEMDISLQGKLLRALQERKIMRIGSDHLIPVNIRLIAATNRNLYEGIVKGSFRKDLFYRINVLRLSLPPLRYVPENIGQLAQTFLKKHATDASVQMEFGKSAVEVLQKYEWPGNVRELWNFVERIVALHSDKTTISAKTVSEMLNEEKEMMFSAVGNGNGDSNELDEINGVLALTNGNYTRAAKILGMSRVTLWRKLKGGNLA